MSLYVGHLSHRVRPEDLLRVFQKFGPCRIQLKDGYGFAVYEARADAERALRNLKGTFICGKPISLTWSNRQPQHFHMPARVSRVYEPFHRKTTREESNAIGVGVSQGQTELNAISVHASPNIREGPHLDDALDKNAGKSSEDIVDIEGDKDATLQGVVNGNVASDASHLGTTHRWGQLRTDTLNSRVIENGNDFDRYEPYHGYKDDDEKINMDNSYGSRKKGRTREKRWRNDSDYDTEWNFEMSKPEPTCYNCRQLGHIVHNCPEANAHRYKFSKINFKREELDIRDRGRLKRLRYSSGAESDAIVNPVISMRHKPDRREPHSGGFGRLSRPKGLPENKENISMHKGDSQSKKRNKVEHKASKRSVRRGHASRSSTSSHSSQSPRSNSDSHSKSRRTVSASSSSRVRSGSSQSRSNSSSSRPVPKSSHPKSMSSRSRSRSRSSSRSSSKSFSLSVSLERKPCSPENKQMEMCMVSSPRNNVDKKSQELENKKSDNTFLNVEDEKPMTSRELDNEKSVEQPDHSGGSSKHSPFSIDHKENTDKESVPFSVPHQDVSITFMDHQPNSKQLGRSLSNSERQVPTNSETHGSTSITSQEIVSALRHYGLETSEGETVLSVENHFGASRLWPWEIVYYRRLKKGPISIENYARRLDQNKEFSIVDKYVRSSSGWGEVIKDDS